MRFEILIFQQGIQQVIIESPFAIDRVIPQSCGSFNTGLIITMRMRVVVMMMVVVVMVVMVVVMMMMMMRMLALIIARESL